MKKLKYLVMFCVLLSLMLTGCYDAVEPDEEVYTEVIGVDKGVNNKLILTVQFPSYKEGSGSGGGMPKGSGGGGGGNSAEDTGEVEGTIATSVEAPTVLEGLNLINAYTPRRVSLAHAKIIVFSEAIAREGTGKYINMLTKFRDIRSVMRIVICNGSAREFILENKSVIGTSISKAIELMFSQTRTTGYFPDTYLHEFYFNLTTPYRQPTAIYAGVNNFQKYLESKNGSKAPLKIVTNVEPGDLPRKGAAKREYLGTAVFEGDKMIGHLTTFETRYFLMVANRFNRALMSIEDRHAPGNAILLDTRMGRKTDIKAHFENGVPVIDVKLNIEVDILGIQSGIDYESVKLIDNLNNQIASFLESGIRKTIAKTQELHCDIFGFGLKVAGNFNTIREFEEYNWLKHYQEAKVNVAVKVNVRRTGMTSGTPPYVNIEGIQKTWGGKK